MLSSRRRHTRYWRDWSSDVCSSDLRHGERVVLGRVLDDVPTDVHRRGARVEQLDEVGGALGLDLVDDDRAGGGSGGRRPARGRGGEEGRSRGAPENFIKRTELHALG